MKGRSKLLLRKRGRVSEVISEGSRKKYLIEWTDSTSGVIFGRSLEKFVAESAPCQIIGPIIGGHDDIPGPRREVEMHEEDDEVSHDADNVEENRSVDEDNEIHPEDGFVEAPTELVIN